MLAKTNILCQKLISSDHYEWGVYVTDAKGNRDTLIFGTPSLAKANTLIAGIGEKQITIPDTSVLNLAIDKSTGLKTKKAFGPFLMSAGNLQRGFYMDSIFYLNQTAVQGFEYYAPIFISGRAINFPLTINIRQLLIDSIWYQRLLLWRLYVGEYRQTETFVQFEEDSFHTKEKTFTLLKSDVKFRSDGTMDLYIQFVNFNTDYQDKLIDEISIFPNPAYDVIYIRNTGNSILKSYTMFDSSGKIMLQQNNVSSEINVAGFPMGVYTLIFRTLNGRQLTKKILIFR